jgi:hypothetical protein
VQILGYADNFDIVPAIKEAFLALERAGRKMVLIVNEAKTIYVCLESVHLQHTILSHCWRLHI